MGTADELPRIRIGTRGSALALWQANYVRDWLRRQWHGRVEVDLVPITTEGDRIQDRALHEIGGKGLFVKAIETELLEERVDLAVHSMKDLPSRMPSGLVLACTPAREDPRDALVTGGESVSLADMARGARIGPGSLRRGALVRRLRPDLEVVPMRGNVPTRIEKVDRGEVDAVLLACAGLRRLDLAHRIAEALDPESFCPAPCQGILALQCRDGDRAMLDWVAPLEDSVTRHQAQAERSFLSRLEADCHVPVACYARVDGNRMDIEGLVIDPSSQPCFEVRASGVVADAHALGREVAERLLEQGAQRVLDGTR